MAQIIIETKEYERYQALQEKNKKLWKELDETAKVMNEIVSKFSNGKGQIGVTDKRKLIQMSNHLSALVTFQAL